MLRLYRHTAAHAGRSLQQRRSVPSVQIVLSSLRRLAGKSALCNLQQNFRLSAPHARPLNSRPAAEYTAVAAGRCATRCLATWPGRRRARLTLTQTSILVEKPQLRGLASAGGGGKGGNRGSKPEEGDEGEGMFDRFRKTFEEEVDKVSPVQSGR